MKPEKPAKPANPLPPTPPQLTPLEYAAIHICAALRGNPQFHPHETTQTDLVNDAFSRNAVQQAKSLMRELNNPTHTMPERRLGPRRDIDV